MLHKHRLNDNLSSCLAMIKMHFNALAKNMANLIHVFSSALTVCWLCPDFKWGAWQCKLKWAAHYLLLPSLVKEGLFLVSYSLPGCICFIFLFIYFLRELKIKSAEENLENSDWVRFDWRSCRNLLCWCDFVTQISSNLFLYHKNRKDVTLKPGSVTLLLISEQLLSVICGSEKILMLSKVTAHTFRTSFMYDCSLCKEFTPFINTWLL